MKIKVNQETLDTRNKGRKNTKTQHNTET